MMKSENNGRVITNISFLKKGIILTFTDEESLTLDEEIFTNHYFYVGKIIPIDEYNTLLDEVYLNSYYQYCLKLLAKKMYSKKQLLSKLISNKKLSKDKAIQVIDKLEKNNLVDDYQFACFLVEECNYKNFGYYKIVDELKKAGIESDIYEFQDNFQNEYIKAKNNLFSWMKLVNNYSAYKFKQSVYNSLKAKGFKEDICQEVISSLDLNEIQSQDDLKLQREYDKIVMKLDKEEILKNKEKIINRLLRKGFSYSNIIKLIEGDLYCG